METREENLQITYVELLDERQRIYDAIVAHREKQGLAAPAEEEAGAAMEVEAEA